MAVQAPASVPFLTSTTCTARAEPSTASTPTRTSSGAPSRVLSVSPDTALPSPSDTANSAKASPGSAPRRSAYMRPRFMASSTARSDRSDTRKTVCTPPMLLPAVTLWNADSPTAHAGRLRSPAAYWRRSWSQPPPGSSKRVESS